MINIFQVRNEVVKTISREIEANHFAGAILAAEPRSAVDAAALREYLLGRQSWRIGKAKKASPRRCGLYFNRAKGNR